MKNDTIKKIERRGGRGADTYDKLSTEKLTEIRLAVRKFNKKEVKKAGSIDVRV